MANPPNKTTPTPTPAAPAALTPAANGAAPTLDAATVQTMIAQAVAAALAAAPAKSGGTARAARSDERDPMVVEVLVSTNPKGGASKARFALYRTGQTVAEYKARVAAILGDFEGRKAGPDISWDTAPRPRTGALVRLHSPDSEKGRTLRAAFQAAPKGDA